MFGSADQRNATFLQPRTATVSMLLRRLALVTMLLGPVAQAASAAPPATARNDQGDASQARQAGLVLVTDFPGVDRTGASDSTAGLNAALAAVGARGGACLWFPDGTYAVSGQLTVAANRTCLRAASRYTTRIVSSSKNADIIHVNDGVSQYQISDLLLDRSVTPEAGAGLFVGNKTLGRIANIESQNSFDGFQLGTTSNSTCDTCVAHHNHRNGIFLLAADDYPYLQWEMVNPDAEVNDGWGMIASAAPTKDTLFATWQHPRTYGNGRGGIAFAGQDRGTISDLFVRDVVGSTDNGDEFNISNVGNNIRLNGAILELGGTGAGGRTGRIAAARKGAGIDLVSGSGTGFVQISDVMTQHNSGPGLYSNASLAGLAVSNFQSLANGQHTGGAGIELASSVRASLSNVMSFNDAGQPQSHGLRVEDAALVTIAASNFNGNAEGGCVAGTGSFAAGADVLGRNCRR